MAKTKGTTEAQKLVGRLQLARIQLIKAESKLDGAKERSRLAKRRRKEAKLAARRAKKEVKAARTELAEAREAMAKAQMKLAQAGKRQLRNRTKARDGGQAQTVRPRPRRARKAARATPAVPAAPAVRHATTSKGTSKALTIEELSRATQEPATGL